MQEPCASSIPHCIQGTGMAVRPWQKERDTDSLPNLRCRADRPHEQTLYFPKEQ